MSYREKIGAKENPLELQTPPLSSTYTMHVDEKDGEDILVCTVGKTILHYQMRSLEDAQKMLQDHGDWMEMGSKDQKVDTKEGTFEHWGRSESNPVGGFYGMKNGFKGRFGMYIPPLMEALGMAEITHEKRGNKIRAIQ